MLTAIDNARVLELNNQAVHYQNHGYLDKAEACFLKALALAESLTDLNPASLASVRGGLAGLRWQQQQHEAALALYLDVLHTHEALFSPSHMIVGHSLQVLGNRYLELGRQAEAANALERAVQIYREDTPDDLQPVGACLASLAAAHLQQERLAEAHRALSEALGIYQVQRPLDVPVIEALCEQLKAIEARTGFRGKGAWWRFW